MNLKSILNRCHPIRGFTYGKCWFEDGQAIGVEVRPRRGSHARCSGCGRKCRGYDRQPVPRHFAFIPIWGFAVTLWYVMRRVDCPRCGVRVEQVPWAQGKERTCKVFQGFLAHWAKRLPWTEVARVFHTSWGVVFRAIDAVVSWGLAHRNLDGVTAVGLDEIAVWKGHQYLTVVYQLDKGARRLLWVAQGRTRQACESFFRFFGKQRCQRLAFVSSDMWRACIDTVARWAPAAVHVLDRFHIVKRLNEAVDQVRRAEAKSLRKQGLEPLTNTRWCWLKKPKNLNPTQRSKLSDLLRYDYKTTRAYLIKDAFEAFWKYKSPFWAGSFLDAWCSRAMRSRLNPIKAIARSLRQHRDLILNYFWAKKEISQAAVEALNGNAKLTIRSARGFRSYRAIRIALFHRLGRLPEPILSPHSFW